MKAHRPFASLALAAAIISPGLALAAPALPPIAIPGPPMPAPPVADAGNATPQEIADAAVVASARKDFGAGDYARLAPHIAALTQVMAHAPDVYPTNAVIGSTLVMRTAPALLCPSLESGATKINSTDPAGPSFDKVRCAPNTYPQAALMLGLYGDEKSMPQQALAALDQGLKLQPSNLDLAGEKFAALLLLKRFDDLLAFSQPMTTQTTLPPAFRGLMLRDRGYALVELKRLDEAQAAYEASLVAQPGHPGAQNELKYIAQLRGGGAAAPSVMMSAGQAATPGGISQGKPVP